MRKQHAFILLAVVGAALTALFVARLAPGSSNASSHREAPLISEDPTADNTDLYAFRSPDRPNTLTIVSNWIPGEDPAAGPNYYTFSQSAKYNIHIDRNGDGKPDITYSFRFKTPTGPYFLGNTQQSWQCGGTTVGSRAARPRSTTSARASTGSSGSRTTKPPRRRRSSPSGGCGSSPASVTIRSTPTSARSSTWSRSARRARPGTWAAARTSCPPTTSTRSRCRSRSAWSTPRATWSASGPRPSART